MWRKIVVLETGSLSFMAMVGILFCQTVFAQGFTPNVRVNDVTTGSQNTEGQTIAVLGNTVYVVWTDARGANPDIYFAKSTNGGTSFESSVRVSSIPDTIYQAYPFLAVDGAGVIYVTWMATDMVSWSAAYFAKSTNGGTSFTPAFKVDNMSGASGIAVYGNNVYILLMKNWPLMDFYFTRSTNGGASFEPVYKINNAPAQDTLEVAPWGNLCGDASGNIYAVWPDGRHHGGNCDIYFAKSMNSGVSFGANIPVNDTTGAIGDSAQSGPAIAVYGSNTVYVVWIDKRNKEQIYFAKSTNGGTSFGANIPVNDVINEPSCWGPDISVSASGLIYVAYQADKTGQGYGIWCSASGNGGENFVTSVAVSDTLGVNDSWAISITTGSDNKAYVVWSDNRTGDEDVYFAKGTVIGIEESDFYPVLPALGLTENYPNPFTISTSIRYTLSKDAHIELVIYNIQGQLMQTLVNEEERAGIYTINWNGKDNMGRDVSKGIYFYQLKESSGSPRPSPRSGTKSVRKMLFLK